MPHLARLLLLLALASGVLAQGPPRPVDPAEPLPALALAATARDIELRIAWWKRALPSHETTQRHELIFDWRVEPEPLVEGRRSERWRLVALRFDVPDARGRHRRFDSRNLDHYERPDPAWLAALERRCATTLIVRRTERGACLEIEGLAEFLGADPAWTSLARPLGHWLRLACFALPPAGVAAGARWSHPLSIEVATAADWLRIDGEEAWRVRRLFRDAIEFEGDLHPHGHPPPWEELPWRHARRRVRFDHTAGLVSFQRLEIEFADERAVLRHVVDLTTRSQVEARDERPSSSRRRLLPERRRQGLVRLLPAVVHRRIVRALFGFAPQP